MITLNAVVMVNSSCHRNRARSMPTDTRSVLGARSKERKVQHEAMQ